MMCKSVSVFFCIALLINLALSQSAYSVDKAYDPIPANETLEPIFEDVILKWSPGSGAVSHEFYFGTSFYDINDANHSCRMLWDLDSSGKIDFNDIGVIHDKWLSGPIYESSLKAYWKLDDAIGTIAADSTDNDNNGILANDANWTTGQINGAINFDGNGDYIECGNDSSLMSTGNFTVSAWVYLEPGFSSSYPKIIDWESDIKGYQLYYSAGSKGYSFATGNGSSANAVSSYNTNKEEWIHVLGIRKGSQNLLYINGEFIDSVAASTVSYSGLTTLRIGNRGNDDRYWKGKVDEVMIFDRDLSNTEIFDIYRNGKNSHLYGCDDEDFNRDGIVNLEDYAILSDHWSETGFGVYKGNLGDSNTYDPDGLEIGQTYYWRVDEIPSVGEPNKGDVWSFKVFDSNTDQYKVWTADSMKRVFLASRPDNYPTEPNASISLARQEYESFQIVILPANGRSLTNVDIQLSDLVKGEDVISVDNVEWQQVGYVPINGNELTNLFGDQYEIHKRPHIDDGVPANYNGWWPDILLPLDGTFYVGQEKTQPVWITVYAPPGTPAGTYTGTVAITANEGLPTMVEVNVEVYDFTIAKGAGHFRTLLNLFTQTYAYGDFTLKHRLNPDRIDYNYTPTVSKLEHWLALGMNAYTIGDVTSSFYMKDSEIATFMNNLQSSPNYVELRNMGVFFGWDEIYPDETEKANAMKSRFQALESTYPDIERITTAHFPTTLEIMQEYYIDYICPQTPYYDINEANVLRANGYENWAYVANNPNPSPGSAGYYGDPAKYCNFHIHYPLVDNRLLWWQMYHDKVDGFLYYAIDFDTYYYHNNNDPINPEEDGPFINWVFDTGEWDNIPWGQGDLIYEGNLSRPFASQRLANIRDGLEDYEYLWQIQDRTGNFEFAQNICGQVGGKLRDHDTLTYDPYTIKTVRNNMAAMLTNDSTIAFAPMPTNEAVDIDVNVQLGWMPGVNAIAHNIYIGSTPETLVYQTQVSDCLWQTPTLDRGQDYYWRIDEVPSSGPAVTGEVWSFTVTEWITLIDESFEYSWPPESWSATGYWNKEFDRAGHEYYCADFDGSSAGASGNLITPAIDCSDAAEILVEFYICTENIDYSDCILKFYNGLGWDTIEDLYTYTQNDGTSADEWKVYSITTTDSQYLKSNFKVQFRADVLSAGEHIYIDKVVIKKKTN